MVSITLAIIKLISSVLFVSSESVVVSTKKGDVVGQKNVGYDTYFGVPDARVDEDNPFGQSLPYPNFETPFNANDSSIMCPQVFRKVGGILQCLRLNIYLPHTAIANNQLPILVWFHGGGFILGSAGEYGGQYLVQHDIIVITVNYRLGPYGFLCLNDASVPGNQGFKDQTAALKWIKENIAAFGGDANKVTIAGESYGGGAVDLHLYSMYDSLFDKAIVQSGSVFAEGFFVKPDYQAAVKIANYLGHNVTKTQEALKVLAKENPLNVMGATKNLSLRLAACKEKSFTGIHNFIATNPFKLHHPLRVKNTKIMFGYNSKEDFGSYAYKPKEFYDGLGDVFYNKLKNNFDLRESELKTLSDIVKRFYLGAKDIGLKSLLELSDFTSDFRLNYPAELSVNRLARFNATVCKYLFSYTGGSMYQNITGVGEIHTEELKYLFEVGTELKTEEQKMIRDRMTIMWAQFVKFGNPIPQNTYLLPITWTTIEGTTRPYLNIDVNLTMQDSVYSHRVAFWDLFWQNYYKRSIVFDPK